MKGSVVGTGSEGQDASRTTGMKFCLFVNFPLGKASASYLLLSFLIDNFNKSIFILKTESTVKKPSKRHHQDH